MPKSLFQNNSKDIQSTTRIKILYKDIIFRCFTQILSRIRNIFLWKYVFLNKTQMWSQPEV